MVILKGTSFFKGFKSAKKWLLALYYSRSQPDAHIWYMLAIE
jgi:hypothetical protein